MQVDDAVSSLKDWRERLEQAEMRLAEREEEAQRSTNQSELDDVAGARDMISAEWDVLASRHDGWARRRDLQGLRRDNSASDRDVLARRLDDDADPGFANRWQSATDRDDSSGDRSDSFDDRMHGADDRARAALDRDRAARNRAAAAEQARVAREALRDRERETEARDVIGQAIGLLIAREGVSSTEAVAQLSRRSEGTGATVREVAAAMVAAAQPRRR